MLITREMDYALRVLRALHREGQLSAAAIAQKEHMPKAITLKVLRKLHTAGMISSCRGSSGGYALKRPCESMHLGELFQALGEPIYVNRCQTPGYHCENCAPNHCGVCRELFRIQKVLDEELHKTSLSAMF